MGKIKTEKLLDTQEFALLHAWFSDTNKEIDFLNADFEEVKLEQSHVRHYLREYTKYILRKQNSRRNCIYGVGDCAEFEILFGSYNLGSIQKMCDDIWKRPEEYFELYEDENAYYEFIKNLYVNINGYELKLVEIAAINDEDCDSPITQEEYDELLKH